MKRVAADVFERFLAAFPTGDDAALIADQATLPDATSIDRAPFWTVLVRGRHEGQEGPHALVLLTLPSRAADAPEVLEFAVRRARANKAPYFVTWTMREAALWRTPKPGVPVARGALEVLRDYPELYEVGASDSAMIDENLKLRILSRGADIRCDLTTLLKDEALELVQIDATYFVNRLLDAVHHLLPLVADSVHHRLMADAAFRGELSTWAVKQGIAGSPSDSEFAESITRQIIYRLLGKVLFYQSLRRSARQLPKLDFDRADTSEVLPGLRAAFAEALKIDYHAVFEEDLPDRLAWPAEASRQLAALIHDFNTRDFASLPQDVIGTVFERLIPPEERHGLGQYFTSENLCDLINAFCIRSADDSVLDPTCGTGTFLIRAYDRLRWLGRADHAALLSQIWGIDIAPFPAELATINLFRQRIAEHGNFPRVICRDFLRINTGETFRFPPPKMDLEHPEQIEQAIPQFDAIIGNFPYVRADQIEKHEAGYIGFLRERLIADWFADYPQLFSYSKKTQQAAFEKLVARGEHAGADRASVDHRVSTYADLYVHLFFHTARFLKPGGRMGIVTSNAWLDVNYGYELQEFFLKRFKIIAILESRCEPWFTEASVNTVVTIVERCDDQKERDNHLAKFVKVKKPLAELIPEDPMVDTAGRWQRLRDVTANIENAGRKYIKGPNPLGMMTEEDDRFRVRILRQKEMAAKLDRERKTVKWGPFLRAPQIFFELLATGKLGLLGEIATPKFGSKTRINGFFHVGADTASRFGIEPEYLLPLIKSPKETDTIKVDPAELALRIFVCQKSKAELEQFGHVGALKYIDWGEQQEYKTGAFKGSHWPEGTWVKNRSPGWWALPANEVQMAQVFFSTAIGERHMHRYSPTQLVTDKRFYFLAPDGTLTTEEVAAMLNSSVASLTSEAVGRVTMGDGALELTVEDARDYLPIPNIRVLSAANRTRITNSFRPLLNRDIRPVNEELKQDDRRAFDAEMLKAMGIDLKTLKPIYEGLAELVSERITLGRMRDKARKIKARGTRAEKKATEDVLDDLLPDGPRRFPDDFFSAGAASSEKKLVDLPDAPLIFDASLLFTSVHTADDSYTRSVKPAEGKYLVYAQRAGHRSVEVPAKMIEVTRTVANYEKYLRELRQQLYEAYYGRTLNTRLAARLTQAAFDRFRLPTPESIE